MIHNWDELKIVVKLYFFYPMVRRLPTELYLFFARILALPLALLSEVAWRLFLSRRIRLSFIQMLKIGYNHSLAKLERRLWFSDPAKMNGTEYFTDIEGLQNLEKARTTRQGVILVTVHAINFRLLQYWVNKYSGIIKPYLVKNFPNPSSNPSYYRESVYLHEHQLELFDGRLYDPQKDLRKIIKTLRENGTIIICQDVLSDKADPITLLGKKVKFVQGASRLAEMTESVIIPVCMTNVLGKKLWKIHFWNPISADKGNVREMTVDALELMLKTYPEAWDYWKTIL